ncbi:MAG TPA: glutamate racemase [Candidatus Paceibacterota bacterium]
MKTRRTKSIGVFDSGFGGLAILKEVVKQLPEYNYVYLGDNARAPYGARSMEVVYEFTKQAVDFLFAQGCDLVVLACNTASAEALRKIQQDYLPKKYGSHKRVLGVIVPAIEETIVQTETKRVGVIATEGTVSSRAFSRELSKAHPGIEVFEQACPLLVPLVEAGEHRSDIADLVLAQYLKPLLKKRIDTLVLGCTHYGHLETKIKKIVTSDVSVISEGKIVAKKLKDYLKRHPEIEGALSRKSKLAFYSTDIGERFDMLGTIFFGKPIVSKKAELR